MGRGGPPESQAKICPKCGKGNYAASNFCEHCAWRLDEKILCKGCRVEVHRKATFCGNCGKHIS